MLGVLLNLSSGHYYRVLTTSLPKHCATSLHHGLLRKSAQAGVRLCR